MSKGQSRRSVASCVHHRQEAEVATAEERERAAAETAAIAARLAMVKLAAARAEVEAAAVTDAARAAAVEVKALCASSTDSSVSADDDRDNELKLAREAAQEQAAQWAVLTSADAPAAAAQTGADVPAAGLTEIAAFTGGAALPPQTGTMVTMGSTPLSGTSVPAVSGLPSPRPTTSSEPR
jgi:hypothetical protein